MLADNFLFFISRDLMRRRLSSDRDCALSSDVICSASQRSPRKVPGNLIASFSVSFSELVDVEATSGRRRTPLGEPAGFARPLDRVGDGDEGLVRVEITITSAMVNPYSATLSKASGQQVLTLVVQTIPRRGLPPVAVIGLYEVPDLVTVGSSSAYLWSSFSFKWQIARA